jgi:hypothetical protein
VEIDERKYKKLIIEIIAAFQKLDTELLAHKMVFEALIKPHYSDAEHSLESAINNPRIQKIMREKYDLPLERLLKQVDESVRKNSLLKWVEQWKPSGPVN